MTDYADVDEIEEIEKRYARYPAINEMAEMCCALGLEMDNGRTMREPDAWAYYHELKAMVDTQRRRTA